MMRMTDKVPEKTAAQTHFLLLMKEKKRYSNSKGSKI